MRFQPIKFQTLLLFFNFLLLLSSSATPKTRNFLTRGSSLSVEDDTKVLLSPDQTFTCGFYGSGENAYWFSIWFTNSKDKTVVWMANRDKPINGKGSQLSLWNNGALVLTNVDGSNVWMSNTSNSEVSRAEILDNGNLVLRAPSGKTLWQSFDYPTDTILPHQLFTQSTALVSGVGRGNFGSGYFYFLFDSGNVLSLLNRGPEFSSIYWPYLDDGIYKNRRIYNSSRLAVLDDLGRFESSGKLWFRATDWGLRVKRRLTLDLDGNLRLYSLNSETGLWMVTWEAMTQLCRIHGNCGRNGICVYTPEPKCSCPLGYEASDSEDWSKGCKRKFELTCSSSHKYVAVKHVDFFGWDISRTTAVSMERCMKFCSDDCSCQAFSYTLNGEGVCYTKRALFNGYQSTSFLGSIYLKLPSSLNTSESAVLIGSDVSCSNNGSKVITQSSSTQEFSKKAAKWAYLYSFAGAIGVIEVLFGVTGWWLLHGRLSMPESVKHGYRVLSSQFRQFNYAELKKATDRFKEELGRGASGIVYKGVLPDEREVAVKKLGDVFEEDNMFWAEVSTIGKIYHMNLVRMWGFCSEGKHRLLVYEYLENSSLDKHIFSATDFLGWEERFKIALGMAKGLAYLHHECLEWVIHCDVKPENILLDDDFEAKIADFGLAKLTQRGNDISKFTKIRGTKGYMAPEWVLNLPITAKVDVYSYGVVILEMVKGVRLSNLVTGDEGEKESELTRFVRTAKWRIRNGDIKWVEESVDPRLQGQFSRNQAAKVIELGIACVEEDRSRRPPMDSVVQALLECRDESF